MTSSAIGPDPVKRFIRAMFGMPLFGLKNVPHGGTWISPMERAMRQFLIASALAAGLIALWAAILPLTAQPAPRQTTVAPEVLSKALFLCRGPNGIDNKCAAALTSALLLDGPDQQVTRVSDQLCPATPHILARLIRRG
jgi:hypothetical protein